MFYPYTKYLHGQILSSIMKPLVGVSYLVTIQIEPCLASARHQLPSLEATTQSNTRGT